MPQSYCSLIYHIVFSTKNRKRWLDHDARDRIHAYLGGAIRDEGGVAMIVGGTEDHVHIVARLRQDKAVSEVLRAVKANSSGWIHRTFTEMALFGWQDGYGAFTVSVSQIDRLRRYVEQQEAHHKTRSFQEEFIALLDAHGIEYDPRYVWA